MAFIVEPALFKAEGAAIDWTSVARRLDLKYEGRYPNVLQLRWMIHKDLGMPTEPFMVWRRLKNSSGLKVLNFTASSQMYLFLDVKVDWPEGPMSRVWVDCQSPAGGALLSWAGSPVFTSATSIVSVPAGNSTVMLEATEIDGLIAKGVQVTKVQGIPADQLSQAAGWQQYEIVGLPVNKSEWLSIGKYNSDQGMIGALTLPATAALQRLERGGPQVGWQSQLPTGQAVPPWSAPNPNLLLAELKPDIIDRLRQIMTGTPPNQQGAKKIAVAVPPLQNSSGTTAPGTGGTANVSPLAGALLGGGTDPWLALSLGFGTAYVISPFGVTGAAGGTALNYDYMITARWEKGLDGVSAAPYELAALVPTTGPAFPPPVPANVDAERMGYLRPLKVDLDWRCSIKTSWDRPIDVEIFRPRTYAFMRAGTDPVENVSVRMEPRQSGGYRYPVINSAKIDPQPPDWFRIAAVDREITIPSGSGKRSATYAVAHQDIYGQWSAFATAAETVNVPPVDKVRIVSATLTPTMPAVEGSSVCANSRLTIEFLWDWKIRRPQQIRFVGTLYPAAFHGDPPPSLVHPNTLQRALAGGPWASLDITFAGDTPTAAGATFQSLSEDGEKILNSFGAAQGNETRRYRVNVSDFSLNYANTGHIGLALWAVGQERLFPGRSGDWSPSPTIITASDPRPPKMAPDIVQLASLPDAAGQCHGKLSWGPGIVDNAVGYFIYESTETKLLKVNNQPDPSPEHTLSQRLTHLNTLFDTGVDPRPFFTKRNEKPITGRSTDITLPKGSTAIHLFVVIGVNAGQVESPWPSSHTVMQAIAAPRVMKPAPPMIEVVPIFDAAANPPYRANVKIGARPGPRVKRVDVFRVRVDDAAKELDTMGPPIAVVTGSGPAWSAYTDTDAYGTNIVNVAGLDAPPGSWKRVWYRAVAWSGADPLRGYLAGRSVESSAVAVVLPPATPPDLSPVNASWPGGNLADVLLKWSSSAPLRKTPLGPHMLSVRVNKAGAPVDEAPLLSVTADLHKVGTTQPANGSGVWITNPNGPAPFNYSLLIRRASAQDPVQVSIRMTDPVGRMSERLVQIGAGPILPAPSLGHVSRTASVVPPGIMLAWTSSSPIDVVHPSPYVLRVAAVRPPLPPNPDVVIQLPLPMVAVAGPNAPAGNDPMRVWRLPGNGPNYSYRAFCRVPVQKFLIQLTSPDGRVAHVQELVS